MTDLLLTDIDDRGVCTLALNRPDVFNAFNDTLIAELFTSFSWIAEQAHIRAVVLTGTGSCFSAGADLTWMRQAASLSYAENERDAERLSSMLAMVDACPKPTVALVRGGAFGGGVGLVACCDMTVATPDAKFALSEVRLGLTPATISPYVIARIGQGAARRLFLTAERISAAEARRLGLISEVAEDAEAAVEAMVDALLAGAPGAQAEAKRLIFDIAGQPITEELRADTANRIAARRASQEGKEGLTAFLEKRKPGWVA
ncbi:MAG: enoyl-CoA hydratase-related protein [Rhodothalassiaceae bacterium]